MKEELVIEQLSIFETLNSFDESRAKWKRDAGGKEYCEVLAYVPAQAVKTGKRSKIEDYQYELWEFHCHAIWIFAKCSWEEAVVLLNEHRLNEKPIGMKFYKGNMALFLATQIEKYL